ncbi:hypothetical protein CP02DC14_2157, partial [Chlamydia psittaci 02DC14]
MTGSNQTRPAQTAFDKLKPDQAAQTGFNQFKP